MISQKISKALLLLDRERFDEAKAVLHSALEDSGRSVDEENTLRALCILGELLFNEERDDEARPLLERVASAVRDDDLLDYEIGRAIELLDEIDHG